jgi:MoaA/NifB/PqqE/SkfB family radical SAM enzyme
MEILKITKTLDNNSGKLIDARVVTDGRYVYMQREDSNNKIVIERNLKLYRLLMCNIGDLNKQRIDHLVIEPSYECNLNCPICFTYGQENKIIISEVKKEISKYKNKIVSISGGEPTLYKDLIEIIKIISERNIPLLATNGLRLIDYDYVMELKKAGLRHVTFSLNGFSDNAFIKTNGQIFLEEKMKAIENLLKADMKFLLSMLLVRGVNEEEIKSIVDFAAKHSKNIKEVRIRTMSPIGKHPIKQEPFLASEILELFCNMVGLHKEEIYRELLLKKILSEKIPCLTSLQKSCSFSFYLEIKGNTYIPLGRYLNFSSDSYLNLSKKIWRCKGTHSLCKKIQEWLLGKSLYIWRHGDSFLKVSIRSWPSIKTLDFQDHIMLCNSRYVGGIKKNLPICYANILYDIGAIK